jgi:hypothetical protein
VCYYESATLVKNYHILLARESVKYGIYTELAYNFSDLVAALNDQIRIEDLNKSQTVIRLYERWLDTHSEIFLKKLRALGVEPLPLSNN